MSIKPAIAIAALIAIAGSLAFTQPAKDKPAPKPTTLPHQPAAPAGQPAGQPADMQLPPGMTAEDMQACMDAATPGEMHAYLTESAGTWQGKTKMWMSPESPVSESVCTTTVTSMMDGRFVRVETTGDFAGMPFQGFGINGYDNVSKKFQSTWCDSMGTGMMTGTGERSSDGTTLTYTCTYNCPINKGPMTMRQVEKRTGKDTMTLEMYGPAPHTNKEYKIMEINYTRTAGVIIGNGGAPTRAHD